MLVVTEEIRIPDSELHFQFARSSGPGGQGVNKVNSKAQLRWDVRRSPSVPESVRERFCARYANRIVGEGELLLQCEEFRDRRLNQEGCLEKLRAMLLAVAKPPKRRRPTKPTRRAKEDRLRSKKMRGDKKRNRRRWD